MSFDHRYQRSRYEFKYLIDEACARQVRDFVRSYLRRDPHSIPSMRHAYPIYTLYLDGPGLMLYSATVQAQMNRFKLRVRYYDHRPNGPVFCEIKRRVNDVILKDRAVLRREALDRLLHGHAPSREDLLDGDDADSYAVLRRFCDLRESLQATARVLVYFEREAWISPQDDNTRVTFDRRASAARWAGSLEPQRWTDAKVSSVILELKFDDRFPTWMRELVRSCDLYRTRMGKYVVCTDCLPKMARPVICSTHA